MKLLTNAALPLVDVAPGPEVETKTPPACVGGRAQPDHAGKAAGPISGEVAHGLGAGSGLVVDEPLLGDCVEGTVGLKRGNAGIDRGDEV